MKRAILLMALLAVPASAANFFVFYEVTPGVDFEHLTPEQTAILQQHGANLVKLYKAGTMIVGGRMVSDPKHARGMTVVVAENADAAKAIAAADPAVRASIMKTTVEPIELAFPPAGCK
jgi:uncharacterized protein YciI